jgi:hypothetical protein
MIDVNKITSTLAKLPDQQLQQYAQMHKSDPYIMALAMSESNRRKEMRAAGQGGQGMQEQPKVVDQMVAEMAPQQLPEEMGIGQLPAGEMNFAGGGIIAFADGGGVERFNGSQSQFVQDLMGIPQQYTEYQERIRESDRLKAEREKKMAQRRQDELAARQKTSFFNYLFGSPEREAEGKAELAQLATTPVGTPARSGTMPGAGYTRPGMKDDPRLNTPPTQPVVAAPKADTKPTGPRPAPTDKAAAKLPGTADLATLYQDILGKQNYQDPAAAGLLELESRERAAAAADRQAIERDAERFKDAYKGREGRLAEREADIGKQKETNTGLAFLNAGLAIMSTPGGLASAIGKGAQVGTAQFAAGLDKIRSAQERLGEARDRLDDLKLNREETTAKELRAAENNYRRVGVEAQKRTIDGVRQAAGVNEARAKDIYSKTVDMTKTVYEQEQANRRNDRAVAASNRTPAEIQMVERIMKEKNIPFSEALASLTATKREPVSQEKLRGDWLDMAKRMQIQADYPNIKTFEDYMTVFGGGTGSAGGAGGFKVVGVR